MTFRDLTTPFSTGFQQKTQRFHGSHRFYENLICDKMAKFLNLAKGFYNFPLCGEKIIIIKLINVGRQALKAEKTI